MVSRRPHDPFIGEQRIYRVGNYGLSCVNAQELHIFDFAWEIAVIKFHGPTVEDFKLNYDTPLTDDVEVFDSDVETNEFIKKAFEYFKEVQE